MRNGKFPVCGIAVFLSFLGCNNVVNDDPCSAEEISRTNEKENPLKGTLWENHQIPCGVESKPLPGGSPVSVDPYGFNTSNYFRTANINEVKRALAEGSDVDALDDLNATPLHHAAEYASDPEVIKVLIDAGANVNAQTEYLETPLHYAIESAMPAKVIKILLAAGANPKAADIDGHTPWDYAKDHPDYEVPEILKAALAKE